MQAGECLGYVCVKQLLTVTLIGIDASYSALKLYPCSKTVDQCLYLANDVLIFNGKNSLMGSQLEIVMAPAQWS